jgi:hypothetical protein
MSVQEKKLKWQDIMVKGKSYRVEYRYNGKEFSQTAVFDNFSFNTLYFSCSGGEWLMVNPFYIIKITTI